MSADERHFAEELQDLLDGRLSGSGRVEVEAHLSGCGRCQRELAALHVARQAARAPLAGTDPTPDIRSRITAALDSEDRATRATQAARRGRTIPEQREARDVRETPRRHFTRRAWIAGAVAAAAGVVLLARYRSRASLPVRVADDYRSFVAGAISLTFESADATAIEAYFERSGTEHRTRVFDLGMMRYRLVGGRAHEIAGRPSALFAYRGPEEVALVCQMFEGRVEELPPPVEVRANGGISFQLYRDGELTLVFWQEGEVVCVLTSAAAAEEVVQLAFAKAVPVEV